jgi:hypothetical protein
MLEEFRSLELHVVDLPSVGLDPIGLEHVLGDIHTHYV